MRRRLPLRWWPLFLVALMAACTDDMPSGTGSGGTGGSGGTTGKGGSAGSGGTGAAMPDSGNPMGDGAVPGDGSTTDTTPPGLAPCLDRPTDLDRPPSGQLPCELLPPGFVAR